MRLFLFQSFSLGSIKKTLVLSAKVKNSNDASSDSDARSGFCIAPDRKVIDLDLNGRAWYIGGMVLIASQSAKAKKSDQIVVCSDTIRT